MDFNGEAPDVSNITLIPCRICGRTFAEPTLVKHEVVCKKNAAKRRKVFDSGKMRALGSDIPLNKVLKPNQKPKPEKPKKSNWRQQHEEFIAAIRAAKGGNEGPPPRSSIPPNFKQCPYCNRNFSPSAADRHIEFCKEQSARKTAAAKAGENDRAKLQDRRTKYQAPKLQPKTTTTTTTKSSTVASSKNVSVKTTNSSKPPAAKPKVVVVPSYQPPKPRVAPSSKSPTANQLAATRSGGNVKSTASSTATNMRTQRSNLTKHNAAPASRPAVNGAPKPPVAAPPSRTQSKLPAKTATKNVAAKQSNGSRQQAAASKIPSSSSTPDFKSAALRTLSPAVGADVDDPTCGAREMSFTRTPSEQALYHPRKSDDGGYESGAYYSAVSPSSMRTPLGYGGAPVAGSNGQRSHLPLRLSRPGSSTLCPECGSKYPTMHAKFCIECGMKRVTVG